MSVDLSQFTVNPDKDFTRKKKWDFPTWIKFIVSMESHFEKFPTVYNHKPSLFKGYPILACDGSDISIAHNPKDEETYFPHKGAKGFHQLPLNAMYDLLDRIYTDILIQPARKENEQKAFCNMADRQVGSEKTIFIVDRG